MKYKTLVCIHNHLEADVELTKARFDVAIAERDKWREETSSSAWDDAPAVIQKELIDAQEAYKSAKVALNDFENQAW